MAGQGRWIEDEIGGHPLDVYEPPEVSPDRFLVLYLHGIHGHRLVDSQSFCTQFDRHGLRVVAPYTGRSWWTDRICPEFDPQLTAARHLLDNVVPFIERRFSVSPPGIGLLGTSMGGQGALRLAYQHPATFPVVAAISPAIDYQIRFDEDEVLQQMYRDPEAARQDTAILHVNPLNWPRHQFFACDPTDDRWWDSADRLRMKLWSLGIPHECDLQTSGGGHGFAYYDTMADRAVTFLADRLDQERRRVH